MKQLTGTVTNANLNKTVVVLVTRHWTHPVYKKTITRRKKYLAHNTSLTLKTGDQVIIQECRPLSKTKTWQIIKKT